MPAVTAAPTGLVWIETPSNPMIRVADVRAGCQIAREAGALAVVDNTWATPALQRPHLVRMPSCTRPPNILVVIRT